MGILSAKRYPTILAGNAADHTYVECGSGGRAWGCWGGKVGGTLLRDGNGSTRQADAIANVDERAGISCYLVNGVCHQAANRVLFPARALVRGARGYDLSEIVFGPYGRPGGLFGKCRAPFNQHPGISGDLPQCQPPVDEDSRIQARRFIDDSRLDEAAYLRGALEIYSRFWPAFEAYDSPGRAEKEEFHLELFMYKVRYFLGSLDDRQAEDLAIVRLEYERDRMDLEDEFFEGRIDPRGFIGGFEERTFDLQTDFAKILSAEQYRDLVGLARDEKITLVDPEGVERAYGPLP